MDSQTHLRAGSSWTAVLLAAGYGSRIAEITQEPKILLEVQGISILERHLRIWRSLGIKNVVLVLGYKSESIVEKLLPFAHDFNFTYALNEDYKNLGNTYSLSIGLQRSTGAGPTLVFDGDLVYEPSILQDFLAQESQDQIIVGEGSLDNIECAKVLCDSDNNVRMTVDKRAVTEQELQRYHFVGEAMGILKFSAPTRQRLVAMAGEFLLQPQNRLLNWEHLMNQFLPVHKVGAFMCRGRKWIEVDTVEDFKEAQNVFSTRI